MQERARKKVEEKQKKGKQKAQKKKEAYTGDDAFPKYANLKTTEDVSRQLQVVEKLDSVRVTGAAYIARTKQKVKNNDNNGQLLNSDASGKEKPSWHLDLPAAIGRGGLNSEHGDGHERGQQHSPTKSEEEWATRCNPCNSSLQDKDEVAFKNIMTYGNFVRSMMYVDRPSAPEISSP